MRVSIQGIRLNGTIDQLYNLSDFFWPGGLGWRPPTEHTRFCDVIEQFPESGVGVATFEYVFFYISTIFEVSDKTGIVVNGTEQPF